MEACNLAGAAARPPQQRSLLPPTSACAPAWAASHSKRRPRQLAGIARQVAGIRSCWLPHDRASKHTYVPAGSGASLGRDGGPPTRRSSSRATQQQQQQQRQQGNKAAAAAGQRSRRAHHIGAPQEGPHGEHEGQAVGVGQAAAAGREGDLARAGRHQLMRPRQYHVEGGDQSVAALVRPAQRSSMGATSSNHVNFDLEADGAMRRLEGLWQQAGAAPGTRTRGGSGSSATAGSSAGGSRAHVTVPSRKTPEVAAQLSG